MNDLTDRLTRLDGAAPSPTEGDIAGDLARAHTALGRRRRTRAALAGTGLTLSMGAALGVAAVVGGSDEPTPPSAGTSDANPDSHTDSNNTGSNTAVGQGGSIDLVAYTGAQPEGFELAKVPEGYVLQGSDSFVLTLAKPADDTHPLNFANKVVIMLESQDAKQALGEGRDVAVSGEPGVLKGAPGEVRILRYFQGEHLVLVQVWETIDLTDDQIVELAEGVTVTDAVVAGVG